jgi:hypothetical protein
MFENVPYDQMVAELYTDEWEVFDVVIDDEIRNMIESVDLSKVKTVTCEWSRNDDEMITVVYRQSGGLFRRDLGELIMADGEYYWIDIEKLYFEETPDYECFRGVALDDSYDTELDELSQRQVFECDILIYPHELKTLFNPNSTGATLRSHFRLRANGQESLFRLEAMSSYDMERHVARCSFMRLMRD